MKKFLALFLLCSFVKVSANWQEACLGAAAMGVASGAMENCCPTTRAADEDMLMTAKRCMKYCTDNLAKGATVTAVEAIMCAMNGGDLKRNEMLKSCVLNTSMLALCSSMKVNLSNVPVLRNMLNDQNTQLATVMTCKPAVLSLMTRLMAALPSMGAKAGAPAASAPTPATTR